MKNTFTSKSPTAPIFDISEDNSVMHDDEDGMGCDPDDLHTGGENKMLFEGLYRNSNNKRF